MIGAQLRRGEEPLVNQMDPEDRDTLGITTAGMIRGAPRREKGSLPAVQDLHDEPGVQAGCPVSRVEF